MTIFRRTRHFLCLLLPLVILTCLNTNAPSASAATTADAQSSIAVTIQPINPAGALQTVTCTAHQSCLLPIAINTLQGKQETLSLNISFVPGNLLVEFHGPDGDFYADDKGDTKGSYEAIWHKAVPKDNTSTNDVTLFLPLVPHAAAARILSVTEEAAQNVTHAAVADLEITTQPAP